MKSSVRVKYLTSTCVNLQILHISMSVTRPRLENIWDGNSTHQKRKMYCTFYNKYKTQYSWKRQIICTNVTTIKSINTNKANIICKNWILDYRDIYIEVDNTMKNFLLLQILLIIMKKHQLLCKQCHMPMSHFHKYYVISAF